VRLDNDPDAFRRLRSMAWIVSEVAPTLDDDGFRRHCFNRSWFEPLELGMA
jgi:hypothetical protein